MNKRTLTIISCLVCVVGLTSCGNKQKAEETVVQVKTITVSPMSQAGSKSYVGTIEESYGSQLSFSTMGTVSKVLVDEGQAVRQGQVLAELDKSTVLNAYEIAKSTLNQAQDAYNRLNTLYKKGSLPEIKYIEMQTQLAQAQAGERIALKNVNDCVLHAPFSGYISKRMVDAGNNVVPGFGCFKLVKIDQVKVKISIPEKEIAEIKKGQDINFTVAALDNRSFTGKVTEKGVQANALSHTYDVRLELNNQDHVLLPGMVCSANIDVEKSDDSIILPQEAVMLDGERTFVWLAKNGQAKKCVVTTGGVNNQGVIIADGLQSGDEVIVEGYDKVSEGTKIKTL